MKIEIDPVKFFTTLLGAAAIAGFAWMWKINERVARIESPDSMISRVETLERLIFPIGVEYEVRKRMEEHHEVEDREQPTSGVDGELPTSMNEDMFPRFEVTPDQPVEIDPKLREEVEDNVRSMIEQRPIEEARDRRGKPVEFKKTKK